MVERLSGDRVPGHDGYEFPGRLLPQAETATAMSTKKGAKRRDGLQPLHKDPPIVATLPR